MDKKRKIALITFWFPPHKSVATNRMVAFTSYLSKEFDVTVFCIDGKSHIENWNDTAKVYYTKSGSLIEKIKFNTQDGKIKHVFKTASRILLSKFLKDPLRHWKKETLKQLIDAHKKEPFDVIISSYAPHETHQVAGEFIQLFPSVKWIADMRDEMSKNPGVSSKLVSTYKQIEATINQRASAILSVSKPIVDDYRVICPNVKHFAEIRNGFNHSFAPLKQVENKVFTMGYFGTFYGGQKPTVFFDALVQLVQKRADFDFVFELVGVHNNFNIPSSLKDKIFIHPPLPYEQAIQKIMQMDANVLLNPRTSRKGVFTGKVFDYISAGRPTIACVDKDDVAAQLIQEFEAGYVAEFEDVTEIMQIIEKAFDDWKNQIVVKANEENRMSLHREKQVDKLIELIKTL